MVGNKIRLAVIFGAVGILLVAPGCRHKYENPITKDTQQPDKVLFDTAIDDIEKGRFERARLTLQTMMNTYDNSEYLAKAKLAMADSWKREGGAHGMAQAEAEYKDFILFYPTMEEAAEAQYKICDMQYQQMDKADRDPIHARLAEAECRIVLQQWPNSKYAPNATQRLLEVQEVLADSEFRVGLQYLKKGGQSYYGAANRFQGAVDHYPLFSKADEALWLGADAYNQLGDRYEKQQAAMYTRIVRDYPLSSHAEEAKAQLKAMGQPVPDADPVAEARMKFEIDNRTGRGLLSKMMGPFASRPSTVNAAKSGTPTMESFTPPMPLSIPDTAKGIETTSTVNISPIVNRDILDKAPDARTPDTATTPATATPAGGDAAADKTPPANADGTAATPPPATQATIKNQKVKTPKVTAPKKRARPSDQKKGGTVPPPATDQSTTPAKGPGGGQAPKQ